MNLLCHPLPVGATGACGGAGHTAWGMQDKKFSLCPTNDVFLHFYDFQNPTISGVITGHEEYPVVKENPETVNS